MRKSELAVCGLILLSLALAAGLQPMLPDKVASHWNVAGQVDGYMPKFWGAFLMPLVLTVLLALFALVPRIDPLKANLEAFRRYYDRFVVLVCAFMFYIHLLVLSWNLGLRFDMGQMMAPALAVLMYYCGILTENAKKNWFVGIRTPWTMSSEEVWAKTHRLGGRLFKAAGLVALLGVLVPQAAFYLAVFPLLLVAFCLVAYSYLEYHALEHRTTPSKIHPRPVRKTLKPKVFNRRHPV